ncbi:hypothetical protein VPHK567_0384 [Vibrio phage K567]
MLNKEFQFISPIKKDANLRPQVYFYVILSDYIRGSHFWLPNVGFARYTDTELKRISLRKISICVLECGIVALFSNVKIVVLFFL